MVPLNRLPKGNVLDEWYPILPPSHAKMEVGSVRVRSKFTVRKQRTAIPNEEVNRTQDITIGCLQSGQLLP